MIDSGENNTISGFLRKLNLNIHTKDSQPYNRKFTTPL